MLTVVHSPTQTGTVTLKRAALVALLDRAKHVVPTRFPKLIFTGVQLEAKEAWLRVRATDGDIALFAQMPVDGELPACVVPFAELSRRVKASKHLGCSLALPPAPVATLAGSVRSSRRGAGDRPRGPVLLRRRPAGDRAAGRRAPRR